MPTVDALKTSFGNQIAPSDDEKFLRLLTEADMRLLEWGRWRWTRNRVSLTPASSIVTLPANYAAILGARVDDYPVDIRDEDYEFTPDGVGNIDVGGSGGVRLIDQGLTSGGLRYYKVTGKTGDDYTVYTISLYAPLTLYFTADLPAVPAVTESASTLCPSAAALKHAMYAIIYEEEHDLGSSHQYMSTALSVLNNRGQNRRGGSQQSANVRLYGPGVSGIKTHY